ncbi:MAG: hypothetical protein KAR08_09735, partial [Candidatus Heimdallarchaeota archaeon]|nr:hypothetical protein [Candidatus Heimdallarchaeota archaeon]
MNSRKTNKIIIGLTILSILVAIIVGFLQYFKQNKSSQVIAGSGNVQVNQEGNNNIVNINKNKIDTIIRSLKFRVRLDSFPKQGITVEEGMSMGPANIMGLFSDKKIRYRFITDYKWFTSKREDGLQGISFIYNPENPEQIIGKRIDFLKNMDKLVINYSKFFNLKNLNVDKHRPIIF